MFLIAVTFKSAMRPEDIGPDLFLMVNHSAAQALISLIVLPIFVLQISRKYLHVAYELILLLLLGNGVLVLCFGFGIFNVASFDVAAVALAVPALIHRSLRNKNQYDVLAFIPLVAIALLVIFKGGSTSLLVFMTAACAYLISLDRNKLWILPVALYAVIASTAQAHYVWQSNGRAEAWSAYFIWWKKHCDFLNGCGLGSFEKLSHNIYPSQVLLWAHNDYLQVLFEAGSIGFVLIVVTTISMIWKARHYPLLFAITSAFAVFALTYSPMHFVVTQVFILCIYRFVLEKPSLL